MEREIISFINLLRKSNLRISTSETIDTCKSLKYCNITNRSEFKAVLRSCLVKNHNDIEKFNKMFELFFISIDNKEKYKNEEISKDEFDTLFNDLNDNLSNSQNNFDELGQKKQFKNNEDINKDYNDYDDFMSYDKDSILKDLLKQGSDNELSNIAKEIARSKTYESNEIKNIDAILEELTIKSGLDYAKSLIKQESTIKNQHEIDNKYKKIKQLLKNEIEKSIVEQLGKEIITDIIDDNNIFEKDLAYISIDEVDKIKKIIARISKKISMHNHRKTKKSNKGKINIKRTIKDSIRYGGKCIELKFDKKKKTKPELVVLCDISGSVFMYVEFMLQLILGIQDVFKNVESYVFVDIIKNVSEQLLNNNDYEKQLDDILNDRTLGVGTDYGSVFKLFSNENVFNKKTILIILGDAENTGSESGENYLKKISNLCKRTYWLNPKDVSSWYEYSALSIYEKYCDGVFECKTLNNLEHFVNRLIRI